MNIVALEIRRGGDPRFFWGIPCNTRSASRTRDGVTTPWTPRRGYNCWPRKAYKMNATKELERTISDNSNYYTIFRRQLKAAEIFLEYLTSPESHQILVLVNGIPRRQRLQAIIRGGEFYWLCDTNFANTKLSNPNLFFEIYCKFSSKGGHQSR